MASVHPISLTERNEGRKRAEFWARHEIVGFGPVQHSASPVLHRDSRSSDAWYQVRSLGQGRPNERRHRFPRAVVTRLRVPASWKNGTFCEDWASSNVQLVFANDERALERRRPSPHATGRQNKTALLHHIKIDVLVASFFPLVREIEEKLVVTDTKRSMRKTDRLPRFHAAGRT